MAKRIQLRLPSKEEVGYCKPPRKYQFKKGQSGNPNGRPKGSLNLATVLDRTLKEPVTITENGRRRTITKLEAAVKQIVNKAAAGDIRAIRYLMSMVAIAEAAEAAKEQTESPLPFDGRPVSELTDEELEYIARGGARPRARR